MASDICTRCVMLESALAEMTRSRGEALAEVERLKVQIEAHETRHRLAASEIRELLASFNDALHEGNKAREEAVSAFRRGAEAMRDAAYKAVYQELVGVDDDVCADTLRRIRVLPIPIPGDKP